jgi:hypothetical protein
MTEILRRTWFYATPAYFKLGLLSQNAPGGTEIWQRFELGSSRIGNAFYSQQR